MDSPSKQHRNLHINNASNNFRIKTSISLQEMFSFLGDFKNFSCRGNLVMHKVFLLIAATLATSNSQLHINVHLSNLGTIPWPTLKPKEAAQEVSANLGNEKIAIVFGREDRGLTNEELGLCNFHINIPSDPEYSSLNLSQAVQILTYEIRLCLLEQQKNQDNWDVELANNEQTERLIAHMDELMQEVEFYDIDNPRKLLLRVRRFFKRSRIDVMEANIFRGLFSKIQKKLK